MTISTREDFLLITYMTKLSEKAIRFSNDLDVDKTKYSKCNLNSKCFTDRSQYSVNLKILKDLIFQMRKCLQLHPNFILQLFNQLFNWEYSPLPPC